MANRTLNFEAGNGNWWRRCNHKRKVLIGSEHTFHWLHWHTSCSFSGKKWLKSSGETMQFGLVSLITDSGGNSWCPWLYFLRAYHLDNLFSSTSDVWLRFWSWCLVEILKMKFDQDLCLNLWYELNPRVRCAFGNVYNYHFCLQPHCLEYWGQIQGKDVWS